MAKKNDKENPIMGFGGKVIDLAKFNLRSDKEQYDEIKTTLEEIYGDNLKVTKKHIMNVLSLTYVVKDDYIYLPHSLKVSKEKLNLKFEVKQRALPFGWILLGIWLFVFALVAATYSGFRYMSLANLNKDIDGDGIPDINIDINGDEKAEVNIDTTGNDKPNLNIDYKGDKKIVFNIDTDGDGIPDYNLVDDVSNKGEDYVCTINCDLNGDGWPDINLDLDGDKTVDVNVDVDGDGIPDLNIDTTGNGKCDVNCDNDNDNKCDYNCVSDSVKPNSGIDEPTDPTNPTEPNKPDEPTKPDKPTEPDEPTKPDKPTEPDKPDEPTKPDSPGTGSTVITGDNEADQTTAQLMVKFNDGETVNIDGLYPDDQPGMEDSILPYKTFTVENLSDFPLKYSLKWVVLTNNFVTDNFQCKLDGTNGGYSFGYTVAPKSSSYLVRDIDILPRQVQKYTITFKLAGTGTSQNEDQGRLFKAKIDIEL